MSVSICFATLLSLCLTMSLILMNTSQGVYPVTLLVNTCTARLESYISNVGVVIYEVHGNEKGAPYLAYVDNWNV